MKLIRSLILIILLSFAGIFHSCHKNENPVPVASLQIVSVKIGAYKFDLNAQDKNSDAPVDLPITLTFSAELNAGSVQSTVRLLNDDQEVPIGFSFNGNGKEFNITPTQDLENQGNYKIEIPAGVKGKNNETFPGFTIRFTTKPASLEILSITIGDHLVIGQERIQDVPLSLNIKIVFSKPVDTATVNDESVYLAGNNNHVPLQYAFSDEDRQLTLTSTQKLADLLKYNLNITGHVKGADEEIFQYHAMNFYTTYDSIPYFPIISDDALLTLIQQRTFRYFWDFGHPVSGLARERNSSGDVVTSGGSGFGLMAIVVGIDRGFITRLEGIDRLQKIIDFLGNADRFHGAWSHWLNGTTGDVIPFSTQDDGGDLVETSYLAMGLLAVRQYLNSSDTEEAALIDKINILWEGIEWNWYTRDGQQALYWHWSPNYGWAMNMPIRGFNEALITYVMAASSPTFTIGADVYLQGWTNSSNFLNGNTYYGYTLPLGFEYGGPLFFAHYSFLGINPQGLSDIYADYWEQNVNHSLINREYCIQNPKNYIGYGTPCWGLTASDNQNGYSAHSPTNDLGVITPSAALSSIPYTPEYSMQVLKFFYYTLGDRLWGDYGFYDAFNLTEGWTANSYLAIDQGPIIVMIENHRSGLIWDLFMSSPEVQSGLDKLGFIHQ